MQDVILGDLYSRVLLHWLVTDARNINLIIEFDIGLGLVLRSHLSPHDGLALVSRPTFFAEKPTPISEVNTRL